MTLPDERYRAVQQTKRFLRDLCDPVKTPRVPKDVRREAHALLRHYPDKYDLDRAAEFAPHVFQERMEPLYKMVLQKSLEDQVDSDFKPSV